MHMYTRPCTCTPIKYLAHIISRKSIQPCTYQYKQRMLWQSTGKKGWRTTDKNTVTKKNFHLLYLYVLKKKAKMYNSWSAIGDQYRSGLCLERQNTGQADMRTLGKLERKSWLNQVLVTTKVCLDCKHHQYKWHHHQSANANIHIYSLPK